MSSNLKKKPSSLKQNETKSNILLILRQKSLNKSERKMINEQKPSINVSKLKRNLRMILRNSLLRSLSCRPVSLIQKRKLQKKVKSQKKLQLLLKSYKKKCRSRSIKTNLTNKSLISYEKIVLRWVKNEKSQYQTSKDIKTKLRKFTRLIRN